MTEFDSEYGDPPKPFKEGDTLFEPQDLNHQFEKFSNNLNQALSELNTTEGSLCGQLMLLDTVLITGTLVVFAGANESTNFTNDYRQLLVVAFVLLILSTLSGVKYYFDIMSGYRKWVDVFHAITYFIAHKAYQGREQMMEHVTGRQNKLDKSTKKQALYLQIVTMSLAFLLLLIIVANLSGDASNSNTHNRHHFQEQQSVQNTMF